jgi:hypothetical protein
LPVLIITGFNESEFFEGKRGVNFKALNEFDVKEGLSVDLFEAVMRYYKNELEVAVTSIRNIVRM